MNLDLLCMSIISTRNKDYTASEVVGFFENLKTAKIVSEMIAAQAEPSEKGIDSFIESISNSLNAQ